MTSFTDRPNTALLVVDAQNGVLAGTYERERVVATIDRLVGRARERGLPVVWVQQTDEEEFPHGSERWRIVPELVPAEGEPRLTKAYGDSFEDTGLDALLAGEKVGHVLVAGAQTDACIRATLHGALVRGYDTTLVADAHTTEDLRQWGSPIAPEEAIAYTNLYWRYTTAKGRRGAVVAADDVDFSAPAG